MWIAKKPIMSKALEESVLDAVAQYQHHKEWRKWGLTHMRKQGVAILLVGPPGTGKTTIAEYLALKIRKKGIRVMSFGDFGSHVPGENARQIRKFFQDAAENGNMTVFLDDCEAVLWDRTSADGSSRWMLEIIDELLKQIDNYKGLIVLATNLPQILDYALERRVIRIIVGIPEKTERFRLWLDKIPAEYPYQPSTDDLERLATLQLTGAEIEKAVFAYSSRCIRAKTKPNFAGLYLVASNHIHEEKKAFQETT